MTGSFCSRVVRSVGPACLILTCLVLVRPLSAAVVQGTTNPGYLVSKVPETAIADEAKLVSVGDFTAVLEATLIAQGFTGKNNWTYVNNAVTLDGEAIFNITEYSLALNPGGKNQAGLPLNAPAGIAFGQTMDFDLVGELSAPQNIPEGSTVTLHWLQNINTNAKVNGYGFAIENQPGFWQVDNGQVNGGLAAGAATGPYYDSNADGGFSTPYGFHDFPSYYAGPGTYLHFTAIPTWDVFTPANGDTPAAETIYVGDFGLMWGFQIVAGAVPEPGTLVIWSCLIFVGLGWTGWRQRRRAD